NLDLTDSPLLLSCDAELIKRVIQNLLGNALKFTPSDGTISVSILNGGDTVKIAITDSGPGIPEDYRDKIFEKYGQVEARQQGKKYSTGIGLSFCKLAVEAHGGEIGVDSEVGKGSTFWFKIPTA
ncbi:MAG: ATP-binding protein, partial [Planctomycetota bacterium]|nr:ATP-binding protein [Planctomycetota bacterium]